LIFQQNGVTIEYIYNDANLVTSLDNKKDAVTVSKWDYAYRLDGNQISKTDKNSVTKAHIYDSTVRPIEESAPGRNTYLYSYDRLGI
jgi:hypothetical protein